MPSLNGGRGSELKVKKCDMGGVGVSKKNDVTPTYLFIYAILLFSYLHS